MHPSRFTPLAEADLREAFEYYERKKPDLGIEFVYEVRKTVDRIEANPHQFPKSFNELHRANVSRFPFGIWYRIEPDESIVIACLHQKRDVRLAMKRGRMIEP